MRSAQGREAGSGRQGKATELRSQMICHKHVHRAPPPARDPAPTWLSWGGGQRRPGLAPSEQAGSDVMPGPTRLSVFFPLLYSSSPLPPLPSLFPSSGSNL